MSLSFQVLGIPAPQGSLKAVVSKNNPKVAIVKQANARTMPWRQDVSACAERAVQKDSVETWPTDGPVELRIVFLLPRPKGHYGKRGLRPSAPKFPAKKPDLSKLVRALEDALTGIVYDDDARIVTHRIEKLFASPSMSPRAFVDIIQLENSNARHEVPT